MDKKSEIFLEVGIEDKLPISKGFVFSFQHLLALTGIWVFPILIGQAVGLDSEQVSYIVQACFLTTGLVTILQSGRMLKLPVVQGPTAAFFIAVLTSGMSYGLGVTFGSMIVAGLIFALLSIPVFKLGVLGHLLKFVASPLIYGTLLVIVGASLAGIGITGWFGENPSSNDSSAQFIVALITALTIIFCMVFGGNTLIRKGAILWGVVIGTLMASLFGLWSYPDLSNSSFMAMPKFLPFGFDVSLPLVLLMLLAFLQAGTEAMGIYTLLGEWGNQHLSVNRVHRGLFSEFIGCALGAAFGGLGTTSYPENVGIIRISKIGSRYVTLGAGIIAVTLSFFPHLALLIAGLPGAVLSAASTILFGVIAVSGIQMLAKIEWDELNIAVAAPSFIIALGTAYIPKEILAHFSPAITSFLKPMMMGTILLITLNVIVNHIVRPRLVSKRVTSLTS